MSTGKLFALLVLFAALSFGSAFTDNSAFADSIHAGYTFIILAVVFGLIAAYWLYRCLTNNK